MTELATAVTTAAQSCRTELDRTKNHFTEVGSVWSGKAYDAAYDRVGQDHEQGRKLLVEVEDLPGILQAVASSLDSHRTVLLSKVDDAIGAGLAVGDGWEVSGADTDAVSSHQGLINTAYHELETAISDGATKITEHAEYIRAAGDLLGSGLDVSADRSAAAGARLGEQDGRALADALRDNDTARIDEILSHLPQDVLSTADLQALQDGKDVTVPAELRDYYKEFYQDLGKDGLLSLGDYLDSRNQPGSPTAPAAAATQSAIADGLMMVSNEKIGVALDPTGKLVAPGDYNQLPPDIRKLVSGRLEDADWGKVAPQGPNEFQKSLTDRVKFAGIMSHADQGMPPGTTFGTELGRQGASLAAYLDGKDPHINQWTNGYWRDLTPSGSIDSDGFFNQPGKDALEAAAKRYTELGTSNHEAAYQLLTGKNSHSGVALPSDLSFGAVGNDFRHDGNYDPSKFSAAVLTHEWDDQGKTAAGLYDWIGEHTHDRGRMGDLSRDAFTELPDFFAPHDDAGKLLTQDGKSVFQLNTDAFAKNPELATGLAKTLAPNIDSFAGFNPHGGIENGNAHLATPDAERLLFLAAQSDQGKLYLETSRQTYDAAVIDRMVHGQDPDLVNTPRMLAGVDARIDNAILNAATYQDVHDAIDGYSHQQEIHDTKQKAAEIAKSLVEGATNEAVNKLPGGEIVHSLIGDMRDQGIDSAIEKWNPKPDPVVVQFPRVQDVESSANLDFDDRIIRANGASDAPIPQSVLDVYRDRYGGAYNDLAVTGLATSPEEIDRYVSGGAKVAGGEDK
ncbi:TPR repeat region-containing protein [Nocardia blacklockiae]|uniref:TPR repeat region-containing protein n=1 Tax=Nocardia blacklockiae TaxID=480036 RepID=UPI0018936D5E|nr:hypothetical protein [Nocardia blacklockiae]MBF6176455.1 hypothetical protein [Nocardia blacklockiae]